MKSPRRLVDLENLLRIPCAVTVASLRMPRRPVTDVRPVGFIEVDPQEEGAPSVPPNPTHRTPKGDIACALLKLGLSQRLGLVAPDPEESGDEGDLVNTAQGRTHLRIVDRKALLQSRARSKRDVRHEGRRRVAFIPRSARPASRSGMRVHGGREHPCPDRMDAGMNRRMRRHRERRGRHRVHEAGSPPREFIDGRGA